MNPYSRLIIAYVVAIPMAMMLGYLVATPDTTSIATLGMLFLCLALPLLIQWHHVLAIMAWNSVFILGFVPGQPRIWLIFAAASFGMAALNQIIGLRPSLRAPELTKPVLFLLVVILVTAWFRGGLGSRVLGGSGYGGKNYVYVLVAIMGYFGLISQRIQMEQRGRMVGWFFLSGITSVLSNIVYVMGPAFYALYFFVPTDFTGNQVANDWGANVVRRLGGLGPASSALMCFVLAKWGIRGLFEWTKPWRLLLFLAAIVAALFSGFRSAVVLIGFLFIVQFIAEGLWRTAFLPVFLLVGSLGLAVMLLFASRMPAAVQRGLAFLPLDINSEVRAEAESSSDWRFQMWRVVLPEVPKYLFLGKGYSLDPIDLYLTEQAARMGLVESFELYYYAGDYHNGPLSVIMPFGIWGMIGFLWLLAAGAKVLYRNYRYGEPRLKNVNILLFSFYISQCLFFMLVFGAFNSQLSVFLGILGFSVSLNGGVRQKELARAEAEPAEMAAVLEPA